MDDDFQTLETFCLFIGYSRSGSSVLASLLDAHPKMIFAHEFNILRQLLLSAPSCNDRFSTFKAILLNSQRKALFGRRQGRYHYAIPNSWQGRYSTLEVLGDKEAGATARCLMADPAVLNRLQALVGAPVKFIHVVRHPLDNIAAIVVRDFGNFGLSTAECIRLAVVLYFDICTRGVIETRARMESACWKTVHHETLIAEPHATLREVCEFLGQEASMEYLNQCAATLHPTPRLSRELLEWPSDVVTEIHERMSGIDFLQQYPTA